MQLVLITCTCTNFGPSVNLEKENENKRETHAFSTTISTCEPWCIHIFGSLFSSSSYSSYCPKEVWRNCIDPMTSFFFLPLYLLRHIPRSVASYRRPWSSSRPTRWPTCASCWLSSYNRYLPTLPVVRMKLRWTTAKVTKSGKNARNFLGDIWIKRTTGST